MTQSYMHVHKAMKIFVSNHLFQAIGSHYFGVQISEKAFQRASNFIEFLTFNLFLLLATCHMYSNNKVEIEPTFNMQTVGEHCSLHVLHLSTNSV